MSYFKLEFFYLYFHFFLNLLGVALGFTYSCIIFLGFFVLGHVLHRFERFYWIENPLVSLGLALLEFRWILCFSMLYVFFVLGSTWFCEILGFTGLRWIFLGFTLFVLGFFISLARFLKVQTSFMVHYPWFDPDFSSMSATVRMFRLLT